MQNEAGTSELIAENAALKSEVDKLKHEVSLLRKVLFGPKKETFRPVDPGQRELPFEDATLDLPQDTPDSGKVVSYTRRAKNKQRTDYSKLELPDDLPREEIVIEPEENTDGLEVIGQDVTEILAMRPASFYVKRLIRTKYSRENRSGVLIAELPTRPIPGGKVDASVIAQIILDKYLDHLPLHRQMHRYARLGMKLSESTIGDWTAKGIEYVEPIYNALVREVKASDYLMVDETPIQVLDKDKQGKSHRGYYWVYYSKEKNIVIYEYDPSRGKAPPCSFLSGFQGVIQTDGYQVYDHIKDGIKHACCMAHVRRKFFEAKDSDPKANWMLTKVQSLYEVEREASTNSLNDDDRKRLRQEKSVPVLMEMKSWLDQHAGYLPNTSLGKAIRYSLKLWDKLVYYTQEGRIEIDNNLVENRIRPIALGRKNYLFAGSHRAATRAGMMYSLLTTCKLNGINPYDWLNEALQKVQDMKPSEYHTLFPVVK